MLKKICNECKFKQDEFLKIDGINYCKSCNSVVSSSDNTTTQDLDSLTAHDKKVIYDMFYMSIEWLEKYIEIVYKKDFPDWESRKQIRDNLTITRTDIYSNPEKAKKVFSTQMFLFGTSLEDVPIFREDLKKEFRQWISATKINNNCPGELKHLLYGFDEVMDGNIEKVRKDMANRKREYEIGSPEYREQMTGLFTNIQVPMHNEREIKKSLENKTHLDMEFGNRFSDGDVEQGEQVINQISNAVAGRHDDFHFYPQATSSSGGTPPSILPSDKVGKITTEKDEFGRAKKQEIMFIRQGARLNDYDQEGKLNFNNNPIHKWNSFKVLQKFEIKNTLSENRIYLDKAYLSDDEISFVIKEFADNPSVWGTDKIQGQEYLIHNSAQIKNNEIGTLMHSKEKFSEVEWTEINEMLELNEQYGIALRKLKNEIPLEFQETHETLEIWKNELEKRLLINGIRNNADKWEIRKEIVVLDFNEGEVLARKTAKINREEDYDLTGGLINKSNEVYRLDYFDDKEQAEINSLFTAYKVIEKINQDKGKNNWMVANVGVNNGYEIVLNKETALSSDGKSLNANGEYYKKEQFADSEWVKIKDSINSSQNQQQSVNELTIGENQRVDKDNGIGKIFGIIGIIAVLVVGGVVVVRKRRLFRKVKK